MSDGGKGAERLLTRTVVPHEVFAARWHRAFGATFPCAECDGRGVVDVVVTHDARCLTRQNCPCETVEVACEECLGGAVACGMCGERAAVQEVRRGGVICYECATETEEYVGLLPAMQKAIDDACERALNTEPEA